MVTVTLVAAIHHSVTFAMNQGDGTTIDRVARHLHEDIVGAKEMAIVAVVTAVQGDTEIVRAHHSEGQGQIAVQALVVEA